MTRKESRNAFALFWQFWQYLEMNPFKFYKQKPRCVQIGIVLFIILGMSAWNFIQTPKSRHSQIHGKYDGVPLRLSYFILIFVVNKCSCESNNNSSVLRVFKTHAAVLLIFKV